MSPAGGAIGGVSPHQPKGARLGTSGAGAATRPARSLARFDKRGGAPCTPSVPSPRGSVGVAWLGRRVSSLVSSGSVVVFEAKLGGDLDWRGELPARLTISVRSAVFIKRACGSLVLPELVWPCSVPRKEKEKKGEKKRREKKGRKS